MRFLTRLVASVAAMALSAGCSSAETSNAAGGYGGTTSTTTSWSGTSASSSGAASGGAGGEGGAGGAGGEGGAVIGTGSSSSSSASSSSSSSGAGGAGGATVHGDCQSDADCQGGACVAVTPGGFRVCQTTPQEAVDCTTNEDQCCAAKPCPYNEPCYTGPLVPLCGGPVVSSYNQCAVDQCTQDAECAAGQICGIAGTLGLLIRACVATGCKVDADCNDQAGGVCAPVAEPCCGTTAGLYCVYPNGGCRQNADCDATQTCQITGNQATCQTGTPVCPQ